MKTVSTREAQHHLSKVIALVEAGEEVVITRRGKKVVRLELYEERSLDGVTVPDFADLRERMGTSRIKGEGSNEVVDQRG